MQIQSEWRNKFKTTGDYSPKSGSHKVSKKQRSSKDG